MLLDEVQLGSILLFSKQCFTSLGILLDLPDNIGVLLQ